MRYGGNVMVDFESATGYPYRLLADGISRVMKSSGSSGVTFGLSQLSLQLPERDSQNAGGFTAVSAGGM